MSRSAKRRSFASLAVVCLTALGLAACDSTKPKPAVDIMVTATASGNGQSGVVGAPLPNPLRLLAVDEDGNGVAGVDVSWKVVVGEGVVTATSTTGDDGIATSTWALGPIVGTNALTASAPGISKTLTYLATAVAGPPATIVPLGGLNQISVAGSTLPIQPQARVTDQFGNPVPSVVVTFAVTGGGGSVNGATVNTNFNGIATVGGWTLGPQSGINTLVATVGSIEPATFTATATFPPRQLAMMTQPGGAIDGEVFDIQPSVAILDSTNSLVSTSNALVTAAIASGTGTLSGTLTVTAVHGVATFSNLAVSGSSAVTLKFTSTGLTEATSVPFTPAPPPPLNLTIDRVHLNQATQNYAGDVPIVAGRQALARVFVKSNVTNTTTPKVRLTTFVNGTPFRVYDIVAPGSPTRVIDETVISKSWNVLIPANEVVAGMSVKAEVDVDNAVDESSETDNVYPASGAPLALDVRQVATMKVTFVPVTQPNNQPAGNITEANKFDAVDFARRVYPLDTFDIQVHLPFAATQTINGAAYDNSWNKVLDAIAAMQVAEGPDRFFYGLAKPTYSSGGTGLGRLGQGAAIGMDFTIGVNPRTDYYRMTIAHEWGHNFGRLHVDCGNPTGPDTNFPYDPLTTVGTHGFDVTPLGQFILKATGFREFMSYCQPLWISDYTYKAVLDWRTGHTGAQKAVSQDVLLIWGRIGPDGVILEPAYEIQAPVSFPTESGPYTVQALDDAGRSMFSISFAGVETDHAPGVRTFAYAVPLPASGARPATLRLLHGMTELTRRSRAAGALRGGATMNAIAPPSRLTQVGNGRARLEWDAATYPGAMVRDPATGQILAFLTGGAGEIAVARDVDVVFSTGVTSVKQRLPITK